MSKGCTHERCPVCREDRDFKFLPGETDIYGRTVMVCTRYNQKQATPARPEPTWEELMERLCFDAWCHGDHEYDKCGIKGGHDRD